MCVYMVVIKFQSWSVDYTYFPYVIAIVPMLLMGYEAEGYKFM